MNTDVAGKAPVEPVFESQFLKPAPNDADSFAYAKVVGVVDPVVLQEICRVQNEACFPLVGHAGQALGDAFIFGGYFF